MKRFFLAIIAIHCLSTISQAQDKDPIVIQFSGIVVTGDSSFGVPHVLIYVPKSMRGTETNDIGYFTMPALAGDSVIVNHIGYKKQHIILPDGVDKQSYTYIIDLKTDTAELAEISILPYPTFQFFKQAFAKVDIPSDENESNWQKNLSKENMERMMLGMAPSSYESYRNFSLKEIKKMETSNIITNNPQFYNPLLNPFAWINLVKELKEKAKKRKKDKESDAYDDDGF